MTAFARLGGMSLRGFGSGMEENGILLHYLILNKYKYANQYSHAISNFQYKFKFNQQENIPQHETF